MHLRLCKMTFFVSMQTLESNQFAVFHISVELFLLVRNGSALPAGDGAWSVTAPGNLVRQDRVAICTVPGLQRKERPSHCKRHQVQAKPKLVRLGHLRGDSYVQARELQGHVECRHHFRSS